jgi:hypothetical protein
MALEIKSLFRTRFKVSEERLDICRKCEHFQEESSRCAICGCFMDYKTLLPFAECPQGKWGSRINELSEDTEKNS